MSNSSSDIRSQPRLKKHEDKGTDDDEDDDVIVASIGSLTKALKDLIDEFANGEITEKGYRKKRYAIQTTSTCQSFSSSPVTTQSGTDGDDIDVLVLSDKAMLKRLQQELVDLMIAGKNVNDSNQVIENDKDTLNSASPIQSSTSSEFPFDRSDSSTNEIGSIAAQSSYSPESLSQFGSSSNTANPTNAEETTFNTMRRVVNPYKRISLAQAEPSQPRSNEEAPYFKEQVGKPFIAPILQSNIPSLTQNQIGLEPAFSALPAYLRYRTHNNPKSLALVEYYQAFADSPTFKERSITFEKLNIRSEKISAALKEKRFLRKGSSVLCLFRGDDLIEFTVSVFGCFYAGLSVIPFVFPIPNASTSAGGSTEGASLNERHFSNLLYVMNSGSASILLTTDSALKPFAQFMKRPEWPSMIDLMKSTDFSSFPSNSSKSVIEEIVSSNSTEIALLDYFGEYGMSSGGNCRGFTNDLYDSSTNSLRGNVISHSSILSACNQWKNTFGIIAKIDKKKNVDKSMVLPSDVIFNACFDGRSGLGLFLSCFLPIYCGCPCIYTAALVKSAGPLELLTLITQSKASLVAINSELMNDFIDFDQVIVMPLSTQNKKAKLALTSSPSSAALSPKLSSSSSSYTKTSSFNQKKLVKDLLKINLENCRSVLVAGHSAYSSAAYSRCMVALAQFTERPLTVSPILPLVNVSPAVLLSIPDSIISKQSNELFVDLSSLSKGEVKIIERISKNQPPSADAQRNGVLLRGFGCLTAEIFSCILVQSFKSKSNGEYNAYKVVPNMNRIGELWIKSRNGVLSNGFQKSPQQTAAIYDAQIILDDSYESMRIASSLSVSSSTTSQTLLGNRERGWIRTGLMGFFDENSHVFILGHCSDEVTIYKESPEESKVVFPVRLFGEALADDVLQSVRYTAATNNIPLGIYSCCSFAVNVYQNQNVLTLILEVNVQDLLNIASVAASRDHFIYSFSFSEAVKNARVSFKVPDLFQGGESKWNSVMHLSQTLVKWIRYYVSSQNYLNNLGCLSPFAVFLSVPGYIPRYSNLKYFDGKLDCNSIVNLLEKGTLPGVFWMGLWPKKALRFRTITSSIIRNTEDEEEELMPQFAGSDEFPTEKIPFSEDGNEIFTLSQLILQAFQKALNEDANIPNIKKSNTLNTSILYTIANEKGKYKKSYSLGKIHNRVYSLLYYLRKAVDEIEQERQAESLSLTITKPLMTARSNNFAISPTDPSTKHVNNPPSGVIGLVFPDSSALDLITAVMATAILGMPVIFLPIPLCSNSTSNMLSIMVDLQIKCILTVEDVESVVKSALKNCKKKEITKNIQLLNVTKRSKSLSAKELKIFCESFNKTASLHSSKPFLVVPDRSNPSLYFCYDQNQLLLSCRSLQMRRTSAAPSETTQLINYLDLGVSDAYCSFRILNEKSETTSAANATATTTTIPGCSLMALRKFYIVIAERPPPLSSIPFIGAYLRNTGNMSTFAFMLDSGDSFVGSGLTAISCIQDRNAAYIPSINVDLTGLSAGVVSLCATTGNGSNNSSSSSSSSVMLLSSGNVPPGVIIAVVDPLSGEAMVAGEVGELWIASDANARPFILQDESEYHSGLLRCSNRLATIKGSDGTMLYIRSGLLGFLCGDGSNPNSGMVFVLGRMNQLIRVMQQNSTDKKIVYYATDIEVTIVASFPDLLLLNQNIVAFQSYTNEIVVLIELLSIDLENEPDLQLNTDEVKQSKLTTNNACANIALGAVSWCLENHDFGGPDLIFFFARNSIPRLVNRKGCSLLIDREATIEAYNNGKLGFGHANLLYFYTNSYT